MKETFIEKELRWLTDVIVARMKMYFNQECQVSDIHQILPTPINDPDSPYAHFLETHNMNFEDRILLMLAWIPYLKPQLFDCFQVKNSDTGLRFSEFGCIENDKDGSIHPTLATALFILAGDDINSRIELAAYFTRHPFFATSLFFHKDESGGPSFSNWIISVSQEYLDRLIFNRTFIPDNFSTFPATHISTSRTWDELVLDKTTMQQIEEIKIWVKYGNEIREKWKLDDKLKPGYRALFYGPSGCGKTFTASLLGKATGKEVYCIDLSMVISKYIGETEKNLSKVFEIAEDKDWILFFDEADALFGKRTGLKDAHDRYANQEVAYLLQRIENYRGLVILSTNLKSNLDDAFARRFQSMVRFSLPDAQQRERLWRETFSKETQFDPSVDIKTISAKYELTGGSILNVVQYCSMLSMSRDERIIRNEDILEGIRREFMKEGKIMG
ncbi:MAG: ATP-binding protein [Paludibacteraceae bacterium]|nr:ATP-binding protein [Paludibacteraceae bacterium]